VEKGRTMVEKGDENDQFQILEQKIDSLIKYVGSVKRGREELAEKIHIQEEKIAALSGELARLRSNRDKAKQKIISLLERIEQLGV
jgi:septal ring factor EnvC (AmiA/AmiB activator)